MKDNTHIHRCVIVIGVEMFEWNAQCLNKLYRNSEDPDQTVRKQ